MPLITFHVRFIGRLEHAVYAPEHVAGSFSSLRVELFLSLCDPEASAIVSPWWSLSPRAGQALEDPAV